MCIVHTDFFIQLLVLIQEYPLLVSSMILAIFTPIAFLFLLKIHWAETDASKKRESATLLLAQQLMLLNARLYKDAQGANTKQREN